jgi:Predicted small integral membrane protein
MRLSGILLMAAIALWLTRVAFGNITSQWNGLESAFRFVIVLLLALVCLGQRDDELDVR